MMTTQPLAAIPTTWRPALVDLERALAPIVRRPRVFDQAARQWAADEPDLAGLRATVAFAAPGSLSEAQARALIRVARTADPAAELAAWAVIWQFTPGVMGIARREARVGGSEGERAAACTAVAELWRQIQRIDLDTNRASIFFALLARARRAVIPSVHGVTPADRLMWSLVDPAELARPHDTGPDVDHPGGGRSGDGSGSRRPRWLRDVSGPDHQPLAARDASGDGPDRLLAEAEWGVTMADLTDHLVEALAAGLVADLGWSRSDQHFARREARLKAYLGQRIAAADTGRCATAAEIAAAIDVPFQSVRDLQKAVNRALRDGAARYRRVVLASIDAAPLAA